MGATASLIVTGVGMGVSAAGQYTAGKASHNIAQINAASIEKTSEQNAQLIEQGTETNAQIQEFNARMAEAQSRDAGRRGVVAENLKRLEVRSVIGAQRAAYGAQGIDVSSGSALEIQQDSASRGELDALTIRMNAARESWGYQVDAENARLTAAATRKIGTLQAKSTREAGRAQALSARIGGQYALTEGAAGAAATLVGGAGNILYQRYGFSDSGTKTKKAGG